MRKRRNKAKARAEREEFIITVVCVVLFAAMRVGAIYL